MFRLSRWCALVPAMLLLCGMPAAARALSMQSAAAVLPAAKRSGAALCLQKSGWNVLLLPDADGRVSALFLTPAKGTTRRSATATVTELAQKLGVQNLQRYAFGDDGEAYFAEENSPEIRHLLGSTPLQSLHFLLERGYYRLQGINAAGEAELESGKKHSIDLLLPLTAETLEAVELRLTNVTMTTHAADVLAEKLGYGNDNSSAEEKKALKAELNAREVFYLQRKRKIALASINKHYYFGETAAIQNLVKNGESSLEYPDADAPPPARPGAQPSAVPHVQQPAQEPARPLTPAEALKAYIKRLAEL